MILTLSFRTEFAEGKFDPEAELRNAIKASILAAEEPFREGKFDPEQA